MPQNTLQELLDYKEIVELKARFVRTVDAKDWKGYRDVFGDEGVYDFGGGNKVNSGEEFVAAVRGMLPDGAVSVHRAFLPEITFENATTAKGIWAVNDYIEWGPGVAAERNGF